jgi:PAS domain-containing protein
MLRAEGPRFARRRGSTRPPGESESLLATLEEARADLMDAIEISSDAYALFDSDDRLVRCNNRYRKYFSHDDAVVIPGMTFESILRRSAVKRFAPEQLAEWEQWIQRRLQSHREPEGTFEHQLPDGRWLKTTEYKTARGTVFTVHRRYHPREALNAGRRGARAMAARDVRYEYGAGVTEAPSRPGTDRHFHDAPVGAGHGNRQPSRVAGKRFRELKLGGLSRSP